MANVAVIGSGPQGLAMLKNLLEENFKVTLFEQRASIGGVWQFVEDENQTSVLQSEHEEACSRRRMTKKNPATIGNVSKYTNCFSDFPISEELRPHMNAQETLDYLESYAKHFELNQHIKLNTKVRQVVRNADDTKWQLSLLHQDSETVSDFDKVVFCTGNTHKPLVPAIKGMDSFGGKIIHSQAFKRPADFLGMKVLVVGLGNSAADISSELVGHADEVFVSHRHGQNVFARRCKGRPLDLITTRRSITILNSCRALAPTLVQKLFHYMVGQLADSCFTPDPSWRLKPIQPMYPHRPIISDVFINFLQAGLITSVAGLRQFLAGHEIELEDGSRIAVDAVIFCTGYHPDWTLTPEIDPISRPPSPIQRTENAAAPHHPPLARLYQNIFLPSHANSIAYLTNWAFGVGIMPVGDLASMAITQVWKGTFPLPSEEQMNRDIDANHAWAWSVAERNAIHSHIVNEGPWLSWLNEAAGTGVNENLGYGVQGWRYWLRERNLCGVLMGGVNSPHILRLFDGRRKSWAGARDAILRANEDAKLYID